MATTATTTAHAISGTPHHHPRGRADVPSAHDGTNGPGGAAATSTIHTRRPQTSGYVAFCSRCGGAGDACECDRNKKGKHDARGLPRASSPNGSNPSSVDSDPAGDEYGVLRGTGRRWFCCTVQ